jgi:hypothetical protein
MKVEASASWRVGRRVSDFHCSVFRRITVLRAAWVVVLCGSAVGQVSVSDFPSVQTAIENHPGAAVYVDAGDHIVDQSIHITADGTRLYGPGRIVQSNPDAPIVRVDGADDVIIEGLTLTRTADALEATQHGIEGRDAVNLTITSVSILNNRSQAGTIQIQNCRNVRIGECSIKNYKRIGVDDRTGSEMYGYAFKVIDGTAIVVNASRGVLIQNNRILEDNIYPNPDTKATYDLGSFTDGRNPTKPGSLAPKGNYANNWHQGSAIVVTSPMDTSHVQITGNYIENAAQGIDIHADHVTCSQNTINHAFVGIKCMHGSKNVIISNNNISHIDLWGIIMMPGTASHPAQAAEGDRPAQPANFTSGNIIAHNIFSDFGYGYEYWNWSHQRSGIISLESGQLAENPVMFDVLVDGNVVYNTSKDTVLEDGQVIAEEPRYAWAVFISPEPQPEGLVFRNNIFHPGRDGLCNLPLLNE